MKHREAKSLGHEKSALLEEGRFEDLQADLDVI